MLDYFSKNHLKPRPEQTRILSKIHKYWHHYKNFVVQAPPGVGKTHIALAIANYVDSSYILTSTIQLQEQYADTSSAVKIIKGKSNYPCNLFMNYNASNAPCVSNKQVKANCINEYTCEYYNLRDEALSSNICLTNYSYLITSAYKGVLSVDNLDKKFLVKRDVIISDEAHNVEANVVNFATIKLDLQKLKSEHSIFDPNWEIKGDNSDISLVESIASHIKSDMAQYNNDLKKLFENPKQIYSKTVVDKSTKLQNKIRSLQLLLQPIQVYEDTHEAVKWVFNSDVSKQTIEIVPLTAGSITGYLLNRLTDKFVFLSATIGDYNSFCEENGLNKSETLFIEEQCPFPIENSPIFILPKIKLGHKDIDKSLPSLNRVVDEILLLHENDKGIIHSTSYKINNFLVENTQHKSRLIHRDMNVNKISNMNLVEIHKNRKDASVLISPSMEEGVDLYDDLARFQIIVKLPWESLADFRTKVKSEIEPEWYYNKMWVSVLQASGRGTRHVDDFCNTYIIDASFPYFYDMWEDKLPDWFKQRINFVN